VVIRLVKPAVDIGLFTTDVDAGRMFWESGLGLRFEELLKVGGGVHQHRLGLHGAVLKLNHSRDPLDLEPGGYVGLRIAAAVSEPREVTDPDGLAVTVVPHGHDRVQAVEVTWRTRSARDARWFLVEALGAVPDRPDRFALGRTLVRVDEDPTQLRSGALRARGLRYLTLQVADVEASYDALVAKGVEGATEPVRLGDTAYIAFVRDPDGNWIELSQRASLTGPLPDGVRRRT
jgi:catechol 2,3-dioxygenase-like lactoylglutathione lyase family enzyme